MSPREDPSFEQTSRLLEALAEDPTESNSSEMADAAVVVADLGDRAQQFEPGAYVGLVVNRALENL